MEDLNKNQIVLLVLLVSFVTSIATGIFTVSLLDQAPPAATQTINRIVHRTVERVVPGEPQVATVIKEVPIIVTEEELVVKAIETAQDTLIKIKAVWPAPSTAPATVETPVAIAPGPAYSTGFLVGAADKIITINSALGVSGVMSAAADPPRLGEAGSKKVFDLIMPDGETRQARLEHADTTLDLAVLSLIPLTSVTAESKGISKPLQLAKADPVIGQSIISLGVTSDDKDEPISVAAGLVTSLKRGSENKLQSLFTNISHNQGVGGPLLNLEGQVVGINIGNGRGLPGEIIKQILNHATI